MAKGKKPAAKEKGKKPMPFAKKGKEKTCPDCGKPMSKCKC